MKVVIFYDSSKLDEVNAIKDVITKSECSVSLYDDASISALQKDMVSPHYLMKGASYVLFMYGDISIEHTNFVFFAGYALGAGIPMLLLSEKLTSHLSKPWLNLFNCLDIDSFAPYFEREKKRFQETELKENAKSKLLEKGYALFNSSYVDAVKNNEVEIAKLFIVAGFSPSEQDSLGTPVLSLAVRERYIEMVKMLIKEGAIIDALSKDRNYTALMDAAQIGEVEIAKELLKHGANPNTQSKDGQTALILSVGRQDVQTTEILLKAHADYNLKDSMGMSALDYANLFRNEKILTLFNENKEKDQK